jgi:hypothetical protein
MGDAFKLLVKLDGKNIKLSFPSKPKVSEVASALCKSANVPPEMEVLLSAPDPDFPGGTKFAIMAACMALHPPHLLLLMLLLTLLCCTACK